MSVIVNGGAGFVGSHLVDHLVADGEHVLIVDDLSRGSLANIACALSQGRATFTFADNSSSVDGLCDVIEKIGIRHLKKVFDVSQPGVCNVGRSACIQLAQKYEAVLVSSAPANGSPELFGCDTDLALASQEGRAKRRFVRLFNGYGPRMQLDDDGILVALFDAAVNSRPLSIYGSGAQKLSMTFVSDIVDGILRVADWDGGDSAPVDLGSGDRIALCSIVDMISNITGLPMVVDYRPMLRDERPCWPELSRALAAGWSAKTKLHDGLQATYLWFMDDRALYV